MRDQQRTDRQVRDWKQGLKFAGGSPAGAQGLAGSGHVLVDRDAFVDQCAQYVISEYYFSEGEYSSSSSSTLGSLLFTSSSDASDLEEVYSKVGSVLGAQWMGECNDDVDIYELFGIHSDLVLEVPAPCVPTAARTAAGRLADMAPQVLSAISAAAKTLVSATHHYATTSTVYIPNCRPMVEPLFVDEADDDCEPCLALEDIFDAAQLASLACSEPAVKELAVTRRIPVNSFRRQRRPSMPGVFVPSHAVRQMSVDSGAINCMLLSESACGDAKRRAMSLETSAPSEDDAQMGLLTPCSSSSAVKVPSQSVLLLVDGERGVEPDYWTHDLDDYRWDDHELFT